MADKTPDGYFADQCIISLKRKGATGSTIITTDVSNFEESGGTTDVEQKVYYGGAYLTIKKPQESYEVSFDVKLNNTDWAKIFSDSYATLGSTTYVLSGGINEAYKIKLEWLGANISTPTGSTLGSDFGAGYKIIYYNAYGVEFTKSGPAEEELQASLKFKMTPADVNGYGQRYEVECIDFASTTGSQLYYAIETGSIGGLVTGSGDTLFGY